MSETVNGPVLETRGLCKSFGALQVANSIDFCPSVGRATR